MNPNTTCAIWGYPAESPHLDVMPRTYNSPRTGGQYRISSDSISMLQEINDNKSKVNLTYWLIEQRRIGVSIPEVTTDLIESFKNGYDRSITYRINSTLKFLYEHSDELGAEIPFQIYERIYDEALSSDNASWIYMYFLAHSGCTNATELMFLLHYLNNVELIEWTGRKNPRQSCSLTIKAYIRLDEIEIQNEPSANGFVAMWFDESLVKAFYEGFDPAIRESGYTPFRIDYDEYLDKIDDRIIAQIKRARFVVADFTQGTGGARGNVYYEAGFAHGIGIPVIFTCRADSIGSLHLDTRQYNHLVWENHDDLRSKLKYRIIATIGEGSNS